MNVIEDIIRSSIWKASSIEETPEIELAGWHIYEVSSEFWPNRTRHFSGYNLTEREGRASSAIVSFDKEKMIGVTKSGRIYKLSSKRISLTDVGDASWTWGGYSRNNKLFDIVEIKLEDL